MITVDMTQSNEELLQDFSDYLKIRDYGRSYYYSIQKFLDFITLNHISVDKITYGDMTTYILLLKEQKYSNGTINNLINSIRCFYKYLVEKESISQELLEKVILKIKLVQTSRVMKDYITRDELDNLVEMGMTFCKIENPYKLKTILYVLFYTGLRKTEFVNLKRRDIDIKERILTVRVPTKNKIERQVPFTKKVAVMIRDYFITEPEQINAFNITASQLSYIIKTLKEFLPNKVLTIHSFRHSFAKYLLRSGADITIIQKLMGHKDLNSTLIYGEPDEEIAREAYRRLIK